MKVAFHPFENNAVNQVAEGDDQEHDSDHGTHIVQVAAHHQHLAEAEAEVKHFCGDQRTPGERPALLQAGNDEGQAGRQQNVPEQLESLCAEIATGLAENLRHLLAAVFHGERHGEQRSHDHDEQNRVLIQAKPEQGQRPPADAGKALQADEQSAHGFFEKLIAGHAQAENHAEHDRNHVADQDALHAHHDRDQVGMILEARVQGLAHAPRSGEQIRRPNLEFSDQDPQAQQSSIENDETECAFHNLTPPLTPPIPQVQYAALRRRCIQLRGSG